MSQCAAANLLISHNWMNESWMNCTRGWHHMLCRESRYMPLKAPLIDPYLPLWLSFQQTANKLKVWCGVLEITYPFHCPPWRTCCLYSLGMQEKKTNRGLNTANLNIREDVRIQNTSDSFSTTRHFGTNRAWHCTSFKREIISNSDHICMFWIITEMCAGRVTTDRAFIAFCGVSTRSSQGVCGHGSNGAFGYFLQGWQRNQSKTVIIVEKHVRREAGALERAGGNDSLCSSPTV